MKKGKSRGIGLDEGGMPMSSTVRAPKMTDQDMRYRAESDMRTMHEAHAIMSDKRRMATVQKVMHESMSVVEKMKKMGGK